MISKLNGDCHDIFLISFQCNDNQSNMSVEVDLIYEKLLSQIHNLKDDAEIPSIVRVLLENTELDSYKVYTMIFNEISSENLFLSLIDAIVKQVGKCYIYEFGRKIAGIFKTIFETANAEERIRMFELRKSWTDIFSAFNLMRLDRKVHFIDNEWPLYVCCEL